MKHLAGIDKQILKIKNNIEVCEAIFNFDNSLLNNETCYTQDEKDIAHAMDGTAAV